jgi:hypothetical protein
VVFEGVSNSEIRLTDVHETFSVTEILVLCSVLAALDAVAVLKKQQIFQKRAKVQIGSLLVKYTQKVESGVRC